MSAQIINMPRPQMLGAIRRDPSLCIQTEFAFNKCRSTTEIWDELRHMPMCLGTTEQEQKIQRLIEELK